MAQPPQGGEKGVATRTADRAATPALQTHQLSRQVGGVTIVDKVSLAVDPGEFLAVIGPNGAGKTSLFNLVSGIRTPSSGRVDLHGHDITSLAAHRRARHGLGRTFQSSTLFETLSARECVRLAVHAHHRPKLDLWRRAAHDTHVNDLADDHLAEVGLTAADRPSGLMSHGDKRKLEIALLLATQPRVMLLDEPLAGVASADIGPLLEVIATLTTASERRSVLMVEHHIESVLRLADRVAVLHHGALLACDTPQAVIANPAVQEAYLGQEL
jgi:branched-chain amino acid transport system ATP-binding protein